MPRGPRGEKRPADVIGNAVHVMRIATGEIEDKTAPDHARKGGLKGGAARARKLSETERLHIGGHERRRTKVDRQEGTSRCYLVRMGDA